MFFLFFFLLWFWSRYEMEAIVSGLCMVYFMFVFRVVFRFL